MSLIGRVFGSKWFPIVGAVRTSVAVVLIICGVELTMFEKIDITSITIPDSYLPVILLFAIFGGVVATRLAALKWYRKNADIEDGEKENKWYLICTIVSIILGIGVGMFGAIPVADAIFIGAGMFTYGVTALFLAGIAGIFINYCLHYSIREGIIKTAETAKALKDAVAEAQKKME